MGSQAREPILFLLFLLLYDNHAYKNSQLKRETTITMAETSL